VRARSRATRRVVVWTVLLGWTLPAPADAQEAERPPGYGDDALAEGAADELVTADIDVPPAEPWRVELIAGLAPAFGIGLFNTVQSLESTPIFAEMGIPLGSRALLLVAATAAYSSTPVGETFSAMVPLGIFAYLDRPRAGAFIPSVRVGVYGGLAGGDGYAPMFGWGALARAGLTWLPLEQLGVRIELGPRFGAWHATSTTSASLMIDAIAAVVVRL
jgi:hypothetical protein